jgi:hypothetical protein
VAPFFTCDGSCRFAFYKEPRVKDSSFQPFCCMLSNVPCFCVYNRFGPVLKRPMRDLGILGRRGLEIDYGHETDFSTRIFTCEISMLTPPSSHHARDSHDPIGKPSAQSTCLSPPLSYISRDDWHLPHLHMRKAIHVSCSRPDVCHMK